MSDKEEVKLLLDASSNLSQEDLYDHCENAEERIEEAKKTYNRYEAFCDNVQNIATTIQGQIRHSEANVIDLYSEEESSINLNFISNINDISTDDAADE